MQIENYFDLHRHDLNIFDNPTVIKTDYTEIRVRQYKPDGYQYMVSTPRAFTVFRTELMNTAFIAVILSFKSLEHYSTGFLICQQLF